MSLLVNKWINEFMTNVANDSPRKGGALRTHASGCAFVGTHSTCYINLKMKYLSFCLETKG